MSVERVDVLEILSEAIYVKAKQRAAAELETKGTTLSQVAKLNRGWGKRDLIERHARAIVADLLKAIP